jgi:hypothetical protein
MHVPALEPLPCVMDWDATSYTSTIPHASGDSTRISITPPA